MVQQRHGQLMGLVGTCGSARTYKMMPSGLGWAYSISSSSSSRGRFIQLNTGVVLSILIIVIIIDTNPALNVFLGDGCWRRVSKCLITPSRRRRVRKCFVTPGWWRGGGPGTCIYGVCRYFVSVMCHQTMPRLETL